MFSKLPEEPLWNIPQLTNSSFKALYLSRGIFRGGGISKDLLGTVFVI
jgi:hypothetical protein